MSWQTWLLFVGSTFLVSATPGSNMLLAFQFGINYGVRKTLYTLAGLSVGLLILLLISLLFVGWLSQNMPMAFEYMKGLAALYLMYLGGQLWRQTPQYLPNASIKIAPKTWKLFQIGVNVSLSNPKAILFFTALFPKFLDTQAPLGQQYLILIISFFFIETFWQLIYTISGSGLSIWLNQGKRLVYVNRSCALVFIFLALGLLHDIWQMSV